MFVCMDVWGGASGPGAPKRSVFMMVGHLRVPPHTKEQNTSPNGLQEYVFMEVLAGSPNLQYLWGGPPNPQYLWGVPQTPVRPTPFLLDIYRGF